MEYEVKKYKETNLCTGMKMVRGAYMNEERHLAKKDGYESPICDDYDASTKSYHGNLLHILNNQGKGFEVF